MDAQTRQIVDLLAHELATQRREIAALRRAQRTPQLAHSSLEEGQSLEVRDETGAVRGRWGWVNGAVAVTTEGGDPVSAPAAPTVTPSLGGLAITWGGTLADADVAIPADFDHMAVHVSTSAGFTPSVATYQGTIRRAGDGGMLPVVPLPYVPHHVVLVPVTTGGIQGTPSAEATATPLQTSGVDLEADSIDAVHIKTGAVEAAKLEAVLALVTTIVAGIPGAARVELDQDGLRGYNELNELIFAIDALGNAVFSGDITGSTISGGSLTAQATEDPESRIELLAGAVDSVIQLWPPEHSTLTWKPAGVNVVNYGSRPVMRLTSPNEVNQAYAEIEMSGYSSGSDYTQVAHYADYHSFHGDPGTFARSVVYLHPTVPILADFHAPDAQDMTGNPDFATAGDFADFDPADFPTMNFTTGPSGRAKVAIAMSGNNEASANSSIALGFRLSGGSTVPASLKRCAYARSIAAGDSHVTQPFLEIPLDLAASSSYTLTPMYRISSGDATTASFDLALPNFITVTPTM